MAGRHQYDIVPRDSNDLSRPSSPLTIKTTTSTPLRLLALPLRLLKRFSRPHLLRRILLIFTLLAISLLAFTYFLNPSYPQPPDYTVPNAARVFIAANIVDGEYRSGSKEGLVNGAWGDALVALAIVLKSHNIPVHISVYGGPTSALSALETRFSLLNVSRTIVAEDTQPIDLQALPRVEIPTGEHKGEKRVKRITYLAAVRNKALEPLAIAEERYTHLLFLNDVVFGPNDAVRLLFGTNNSPEADATSHPNYRAACALDFITSWKFYDSFASRDTDGYGIGIPLFPWFGSQGSAITRKDLLSGRDTVRVKSCWGGMVAFEARFFQGLLPSSPTSNSSALEADTREYRSWASAVLPPAQAQNLPVHFRAEPHPFWDASECCLVHADITTSPSTSTSTPRAVDAADQDTGIFINPHVRVAYSASVFAWLPFAQRFERLWIYPQYVINKFAGMPRWNILREKAGARSYLGDMDIDPGDVTVPVEVRDGFCQVRQLLLLREGKLAPGMRNWEKISGVVPPVS